MEPVTRLLFERPFTQAAAELFALAIVLAGWWQARYDPRAARRWLYAVVAVLAVSLAGQLTQYLVTTDREQIERIFHTIAEAVERRDVKTILALCDESVEVEGLNKDQLGVELKGTLRANPVTDPYIWQIDIRFPSRDAATAFVSATASVETPVMKRTVLGKWDVGLVKAVNRWLIVSVQPLDHTRRMR